MVVVETRLDIYTCWQPASSFPTIQRRGQTLVILAAAGKQTLATLATQLAEHGFLVAVTEKHNPQQSIQNATWPWTFASLDFLRVMDYMQSGAWRNDNEEQVEIQEVVLGGHGMGGTMA